MKLTNQEVYNAGGALRELMNQKLPVMVSYKLAKVGRELNKHLEVIEEVRLSLIKKYGAKGPRGEEVPPFIEVKGEDGVSLPGEGRVEPNPNYALFQEEFKELLKQEVKVDLDGKVKLPEKVAATCDKCHHNMDKGLEIEARILMALEFCVEV